MGFVNRKRQDGIDLVTGIRFCGSEGCDILCACLTFCGISDPAWKRREPQYQELADR